LVCGSHGIVSANASTAPPSPQGLRWASFGDSYAAGEGLPHPSYEDITPWGNGNPISGSGDQNHYCQRALARDTPASVAWGAKLAAGKAGPFAFVACSGAITDDLFPTTGSRREADQLAQARNISRQETFDVVTLSFGGNNLGFGDIVSDCIGMTWGDGPDGWLGAPWMGCTVSEDEMKARVDRLTNVDSVNEHPDCSDLGVGGWDTESKHFDDDGLAQGRITVPELYDVIGRCVAPGGTVIVMGYPHLVEDPARWRSWEGSRCNRIRRADAVPLRGATVHLNNRLQEAVAWANANTPARFVFINANQFWEGGSLELDDPSPEERAAPKNRHALCGPGEDWTNGFIAGSAGDGKARFMRSFHPNQLGHDAMASAASHVELGPAQPQDAPTAGDTPSENAEPGDLVGPSLGVHEGRAYGDQDWYNVRITFAGSWPDKLTAHIEYPGLDCGGYLEQTGVQDGGVPTFTEHITFGTDRCIDNGTVTLMSNGHWVHFDYQNADTGHHIMADLTPRE